MQTFNIKTWSPTQPDHLHRFFILSKGKNAGRPMEQPCPNCFVVTTSNEADKLVLYWLCYTLWQSGQFRHYLVGSVIEFLHIDEVRKLLRDHSLRIEHNPDQHLKFLNLLQNLLVYESKLNDQLEKLRRLKASLAQGALRT